MKPAWIVSLFTLKGIFLIKTELLSSWVLLFYEFTEWNWICKKCKKLSSKPSLSPFFSLFFILHTNLTMSITLIVAIPLTHVPIRIFRHSIFIHKWVFWLIVTKYFKQLMIKTKFLMSQTYLSYPLWIIQALVRNISQSS